MHALTYQGLPLLNSSEKTSDVTPISDNLKLYVGFFVNQTFTMAFNPRLSKRLSGLVSTLTLQNFSIMMKTFANYNYGDDWAVSLIDITEKSKFLP